MGECCYLRVRVRLWCLKILFYHGVCAAFGALKLLVCTSMGSLLLSGTHFTSNMRLYLTHSDAVCLVVST